MDTRAKQALMKSIISGECITREFPFEQVTTTCGGRKTTGSPTKAIYRWWGYKTARALFHEKGIVQDCHFDLIHWKGMDRLMRTKFPRMLKVFLAKHVSGCCGVNAYLSHWDESVENVCNSCKGPNEDIYHITTCPDKDRTTFFQSCVDDVVKWMKKARTDPVIAGLIESYLRNRDSLSMRTGARPFLGQKYALLIKYHDELGWRNFTEGRFVTLYVELQREYIRGIETYQTAESWAVGLMEQLIRLTHRQWCYRNCKIHFKRSDGRTALQHEEIVEKVKDLMWTDPGDLLPEDRPLLEEDFEELAASTAADREFWVASMETAIAAAGHVRLKRRRDRLEAASGMENTVSDDPSVDTEGSIRFRRRRKKN